MKRIANANKHVLVGGYRRAAPKTKVSQFKGLFNLKSVNDFSHNLGLISMAVSTSASNVMDVIQEATEPEKSNSFYSYKSYNGHPYSSYLSSRARMADGVRPMVRFGAYSYRNSINFGLP